MIIAGTVSKNEAGERVDVDDISTQVEYAPENVAKPLDLRGAKPADVTRIRFFTTDMDQ